MIGLLVVSAALAVPPTVDVVGTCPGAVDLEIAGLTPSGNFAIFASAGAGAHVVPAGPCAGVATGLAAPPAWAGLFSDGDGDGMHTLSPTLPVGACDKDMVVLDLDSCTVSPPTGLDSGAAGPCVEIAGINTGDDYDDAVSAGGIPVGMRYIAPLDLSVDRIEIFTGEQSGSNLIALWSHDPVLDQPSFMLSSGSWMMDDTNSWQGANLDATVELTAGETYWIVWEPVSGAQWTQDLGGDIVTYKATSDDYASWFGPYEQPYKHKLFSCD